uniref:Uncharacterized protein n=1 Tax=Triticum urartu TaxID=4572 RepID=A0A8R7R5E2_TRIUA
MLDVVHMKEMEEHVPMSQWKLLDLSSPSLTEDACEGQCGTASRHRQQQGRVHQPREPNWSGAARAARRWAVEALRRVAGLGRGDGDFLRRLAPMCGRTRIRSRTAR